MSKKKILIFSLSYYPGFIGGAELAIKEITDRINPLDFEFHLICPRWDKNHKKIDKVGNVIVHRIGPSKRGIKIAELSRFPYHYYKAVFQFHAAVFAWRLHRKEKFDIVWAMMAHAVGVPANIFKKLCPEVKYLLTLQEGDPPEQILKTMKIFGSLFTDTFKNADMIQVISNFLGDWARDMNANAPILRIPNGVDVNLFSKSISDLEKKLVLEKINHKNDNRYIITTSRLVFKNGVDTVIKSLPLLSDNIHFLILGIGPDEIELKNISKALGVEGRVHFLGQVDYLDIPKYLAISDVFTRPSRSEGMGNSFIEAMAARVPVVATSEGGIKDFLFDKEYNIGQVQTGLISKTGDPVSLAKSLNQMLKNEPLRKDCINNAYLLVKNDYDWNSVAEQMKKEIFLNLLLS